jgi:hypothetical protein
MNSSVDFRALFSLAEEVRDGSFWFESLVGLRLLALFCEPVSFMELDVPISASSTSSTGSPAESIFKTSRLILARLQMSCCFSKGSCRLLRNFALSKVVSIVSDAEAKPNQSYC